MRALLAFLALIAPTTSSHTSRSLIGERPAAVYARPGTSRALIRTEPDPHVTHHRVSRVQPARTPRVARTAPTHRCPQWEPLLAAWAPPGGWSVERMSGLMWRESRCQPEVHTSCCWGLLEIHQVHDAALSAELGVEVSPATLLDPVVNVRAAAALCHARRVRHQSCYADWNGGRE